MSSFANKVVVDPIALYERMGPVHYREVATVFEWRGPADMERILADQKLAGATVVDLGIGDGPLSRIFRKASAAWIIGVDGARNYLDHCMRKGLADEVEQADLSTGIVSLPDACAEFVTASGLLSYLRNPEALVWEMRRLLTKDGVAAVNFHSTQNGIEVDTISATSVHPQGVVRVNSYDPSHIENIFNDVGMKLEAEIKNPAGLRRGGDFKRIPLMTQRYRVA